MPELLFVGTHLGQLVEAQVADLAEGAVVVFYHSNAAQGHVLHLAESWLLDLAEQCMVDLAESWMLDLAQSQMVESHGAAVQH
jgi:predicted RNA-binding protein with PUA-like domain